MILTCIFVFQPIQMDLYRAGVEIPEAVRKMDKRFLGRKKNMEIPRLEMAVEQFTRAVDAGENLALHWIKQIERAHGHNS